MSSELTPRERMIAETAWMASAMRYLDGHLAEASLLASIGFDQWAESVAMTKAPPSEPAVAIAMAYESGYNAGVRSASIAVRNLIPPDAGPETSGGATHD